MLALFWSYCNLNVFKITYYTMAICHNPIFEGSWMKEMLKHVVDCAFTVKYISKYDDYGIYGMVPLERLHTIWFCVHQTHISTVIYIIWIKKRAKLISTNFIIESVTMWRVGGKGAFIIFWLMDLLIGS